ncbi:MAG: hypothetical protein U0X39_08195 [Bacteroidales bacterium]
MLDKTIFSYKDLEIKLTDHANEKVLELLDRTVLGSEGGMRYALQNISERIKIYHDRIRFISLYKKNKVTGTIGSCFRHARLGDKSFMCSYIRYLAVHSGYQSDFTRRELRREKIKPEKEDSFKHKTLELFGKPSVLEVEGLTDSDKHIMYAYVESMNERSKNLVNQAGYEQIRSFLTVAFSRFSPKRSISVSGITDDEKPEMLNLLSNYYKGHSMYTGEFVFREGNYYVLREGGKIIAGVNAIPNKYKVYHVPGVWGWIFMKILPYLPYYRRLFQPGEFRFLVFDSVYCQEGEEKKLERLFESVCSLEGFNTGLTWLDDRSMLYEKLKTGVNMGVLNRMLNAKPGIVFAKFVNFTDKEKEPFYDSPVFITGVDIT